MRVLVLGADGFIGRHIAFALRDAGFEVTAQARRTDRLAAMGFATLRADLTDPACHDAAFWAGALAGGAHLVNAAGLLTGSRTAFEAVHDLAPRAAIGALTGRAICISAVGVQADTPFARWRRQTEAVFAGHTILRPGLVMGDTSYGGTSLLRAMAAMPFCTPVVGAGDQHFNPIHAADLAQVVVECLRHPHPGIWDIGGPEVVDQSGLARALRRWLGLRPAPLLRMPVGMARLLGHLGDVLRFGPVSATAVAQLQSGVLSHPQPLCAQLATQPRGVSQFIAARPAGTQDLWHARLYLIKPLIRLVLAALWLCSAGLGLFLPVQDFASRLAVLPVEIWQIMARLGGLADLWLGIALLRNWLPKPVALAQIGMVLAYSIGLGAMAPALWLDPFGALLKNLPVLALIVVHLVLIEER